jgi:uncharacterized repeat protein (TIGR03837 family)
MGPSPRWDIFCAVVDNFGDAGIAWRLARCLSLEHGLPVRLYVDALATLARLAPGVDASRARQRRGGIEIRAWGGPKAELPRTRPGAVVIEAFGCGLPPAYLRAMAARDRPPAWINLEYLSAESWIEDCHGLASRHPTLPLTRYFFFPGFAPASGGLLRERGLLARRDAFRADRRARSALWRTLGVTPPDEGLVASLFCYPGAPVTDLLDAWAGGDERLLCLVPEGIAGQAVERWTQDGRALTRGSLTLVRVPFVSQDDYDRILWACDLNFVRGEDSFVRAQWAARPFFWHVYPQAEDAHRLKLETFLGRYTAELAPEAASALARLSRAWNGHGDVGRGWRQVERCRAALDVHAERWAAKLALRDDLAMALVKFCRDRL